jgi:uncharacterized membrane protein
VFDELFGLPAHPLLVHAPVVLIPLTVLAAFAYGLVPPLRRRIGWLLALFALSGAGSAYAAAESGEKLRDKLLAADVGADMKAKIQQHEDFGGMLQNIAILLAVIAVVLVVVDFARGRRGGGSGDGSHSGSPRSGGLLLGVVSLVLTLGLLGVAGTAGYYVVRTGHTGAQMEWSGR